MYVVYLCLHLLLLSNPCVIVEMWCFLIWKMFFWNGLNRFLFFIFLVVILIILIAALSITIRECWKDVYACSVFLFRGYFRNLFLATITVIALPPGSFLCTRSFTRFCQVSVNAIIMGLVVVEECSYEEWFPLDFWLNYISFVQLIGISYVDTPFYVQFWDLLYTCFFLFPVTFYPLLPWSQPKFLNFYTDRYFTPRCNFP